jgi:hypothetical protein
MERQHHKGFIITLLDCNCKFNVHGVPKYYKTIKLRFLVESLNDVIVQKFSFTRSSTIAEWQEPVGVSFKLKDFFTDEYLDLVVRQCIDDAYTMFL